MSHVLTFIEFLGPSLLMVIGVAKLIATHSASDPVEWDTRLKTGLFLLISGAGLSATLLLLHWQQGAM